MKTLRITKANANDLFLIPAINHLESRKPVQLVAVGLAVYEPMTEAFQVTTMKGKVSIHRTATRALEALYIISGLPLHTT